MSSLTPSQMLSIEKWVGFYRNHTTYKYVGVMQGRFYDAQGKRTKAWEKARMVMNKGLLEQKDQQELIKRYPNCNTKWADGKGHEVSCVFFNTSKNMPTLTRAFSKYNAGVTLYLRPKAKLYLAF